MGGDAVAPPVVLERAFVPGGDPRGSYATPSPVGCRVICTGRARKKSVGWLADCSVAPGLQTAAACRR